MTQQISIGSVVVHKNGYIKGTGVVIGKSDDEFPEYEVVWQNRSVCDGRFKHCGFSLMNAPNKLSLAKSNV